MQVLLCTVTDPHRPPLFVHALRIAPTFPAGPQRSWSPFTHSAHRTWTSSCRQR